MLTYFSVLLSGTENPFWPHVFLISAAVLAGIAVGTGIIFESHKYSARVNSVATILVIVGVVIESLCTVSLFVIDEAISRVQQSTIEQLLRPRKLSQAQKDRIAHAIRPFPPAKFMSMTNPDAEPWHFALDISDTLRTNGWEWLPFPGIFALQPLDGRPSSGTTIADHIEIQASPELGQIAKALGDAIRDPGVIGMEDVRVVIQQNIEIINVIVGSKR